MSAAKVARSFRDVAAGALSPFLIGREWRRRRLLIIGYHGVSLNDEHLWDGHVYMSPEMFRARLALLQRHKCCVMPLQSAVARLYAGTLPPRSVALVFDDGFHDFAKVAAPILAEFGYPATVYWSTYYAHYNRPVFDIMLRYLLWKGAFRTLRLPGTLRTPLLLNESGQARANQLLRGLAFTTGMSARSKDLLLNRVATALNIDYEELCRRRLLHLMNVEEGRRMYAAGHDLQMHTHRHRVSRDRELFAREIRDNRDSIRRAAGLSPTHFSYPGGVWEPVRQEWLAEAGIRSAVTCQPGLASARSNPLLLPRFMDNSFVPKSCFRGWLAGSMAFFPRAKDVQTPGQILEETTNFAAEEKALAAHSS